MRHAPTLIEAEFVRNRSLFSGLITSFMRVNSKGSALHGAAAARVRQSVRRARKILIGAILRGK
jgi:hypothetical protein